MWLFIKYWMLTGFVCCTLTHLIYKFKSKTSCNMLEFICTYIFSILTAPISIIVLIFTIIEKFNLWGNVKNFLNKKVY